jgi:hypothetical protein
MLDDINPSKEVMKWIIVALCTILASSFIYQKITGNSASDDIKSLKAKVELLEKRTEVLNANDHVFSIKYESVNVKLEGSITNLKNYFDKRMEFVISNEDTKNKKFIMSVFEMSNVNVNSLIPKSMAAPALEKMAAPALMLEKEEAPVNKEAVEENSNDTSKVAEEKVQSAPIDTAPTEVQRTEIVQNINDVSVKTDTVKKSLFKRIFKIK